MKTVSFLRLWMAIVNFIRVLIESRRAQAMDCDERNVMHPLCFILRPWTCMMAPAQVPACRNPLVVQGAEVNVDALSLGVTLSSLAIAT